MKKKLALLLASLMMVAALGGCSSSTPEPSADSPASTEDAATTEDGGSDAATDDSAAPSGDPIKIGAIFPKTGLGADNGVMNFNGCKLAVEDFNAKGGVLGRPIELIEYDNMSDVNQCKAIAERMLSEHPDLVAVTGAAGSSYVLPMLPVFEKAGVNYITGQVSESITNQGYQYVFQSAAQGGGFAKAQVDFLIWLNEEYDLGLSKIGIVYEDTEWGASNTSGAIKAVEEAADSGLEIVYQAAFPAGSSDLSSIVTQLMQSGAEVVFPTCYTQDAKLLFNTMASMNYTPVINGGGGGFLYPAFGVELGDAVDGVLSVGSHAWDTKNIMDNPEFADIGARYEEKYGEFASEHSIVSYNATYMMLKAIEAAGTDDRDAVRDAMRALEIDCLTPGSPSHFNEAGWMDKSYAVMTQWQKREDGKEGYIPRTVFPKEVATAEFQLPESFK